MNIEKANKLIKDAYIAGGLVAVATLIGSVLSLFGIKVFNIDIYGFIDVIILSSLSFGLYRKSRVCAIFLLIFYLFSRVVQIPFVVKNNLYASYIVAIVFIYYFVQGIIGTVYYHKLSKTK